MKNIFLFLRLYFNFLCFLVLQIICIILLSRNSKSHEAFFSSAANEATGKINTQFDKLDSYLRLQEINTQLSKQNARLLDSLPSNFIRFDTSKFIVKDSVTIDSVPQVRKYNYMPARVVSNTFTMQYNYLTLERGSRQGVRNDMSVIGPNGIVGVVVAVSDNYCRVMSLLHRKSNISVMIKKNNGAGYLEWDGKDPETLSMRKLPKSVDIKKGDTVVTSTYSSNFPPNMVVGTISTITPDPSSNSYTLKIKAATNFYALQFVYIVANSFYKEQHDLETTKLKFGEPE